MNNVAPLYPRTTGNFTLETDTEDIFDKIIEETGLFTNFKRPRGHIGFNQKLVQKTGVEIDRILIPNKVFCEAGWEHGAIGVELKKTNEKIGPAFSQTLDYSNSIFRLPASARYIKVVPSVCLVFPMEKAHGPLASIMAQTRVGSLEHRDYGGRKELIAYLGEQILFKLQLSVTPAKILKVMKSLCGETYGRR